MELGRASPAGSRHRGCPLGSSCCGQLSLEAEAGEDGVRRQSLPTVTCSAAVF